MIPVEAVRLQFSGPEWERYIRAHFARPFSAKVMRDAFLEWADKSKMTFVPEDEENEKKGH